MLFKKSSGQKVRLAGLGIIDRVLSTSSQNAIANDIVTGALNQLESDLDGKVDGKSSSYAGDANNVLFPSTVGTIPSTSNTPTASYGVLFSFQFGDGVGSDWKYQIWFDVGSSIYFRNNINNDGWSAWHQLQIVS